MKDIISAAREKNREVSENTNSKVIKLLLRSARLTRTSNDSEQLIRSLVVSVVAFIVDFGLLIILKEKAGLHYLVAATISYCMGLIVNYWLSVKWVFADRKLASRHAEFLIFVIISLVGLVLNNLVLSGLVQLMHMDYKIGKLIATVVVFFLNFLARKKILY